MNMCDMRRLLLPLMALLLVGPSCGFEDQQKSYLAESSHADTSLQLASYEDDENFSTGYLVYRQKAAGVYEAYRIVCPDPGRVYRALGFTTTTTGFLDFDHPAVKASYKTPYLKCFDQIELAQRELRLRKDQSSGTYYFSFYKTHPGKYYAVGCLELLQVNGFQPADAQVTSIFPEDIAGTINCRNGVSLVAQVSFTEACEKQLTRSPADTKLIDALKAIYISESGFVGTRAEVSCMQLNDHFKERKQLDLSKVTLAKPAYQASGPLSSLADISLLSSLPSLEWLDLSGQSVVNVQPLMHLIQLRFLNLNDNKVLSQVDALGKLPLLESLGLGFNQIRMIDGLSSLTLLKELDLRHNAIASLNALTAMTSLEYLGLAENPLLTGMELKKLVGLVKIDWADLWGISADISDCPFRDYVALAGATPRKSCIMESF